MKNTRLYILVECAVMLALSVALSFLKIWQMPYGGAVTLLSMLPLCIISIRHGTLWGLGTAFCYSWFQILQGGVFAWGLTPGILIACLLLDYILAFTVLGLAGVFRKLGKGGAIAGVATVCVLRFGFHFLSGYYLWANFDAFKAFGETFVNRPGLYSLVYNGSYMLPELVFTTVAAAILFGVPAMNKLLQKKF